MTVGKNQNVLSSDFLLGLSNTLYYEVGSRSYLSDTLTFGEAVAKGEEIWASFENVFGRHTLEGTVMPFAEIIEHFYLGAKTS
jgi:hypothetical protein